MNKEEGIILDNGRLITTFKELEGEYLKLSADYQFIRMNLEFTDNALRKAKDEIVNLQSKLKAEVSWLKQMNKGLVELSKEVLRGANNE